MLLVSRIHFDFLISREVVHEGHPLETTRNINYDIRDWERELVFEISDVQIMKVYADLDFFRSSWRREQFW